MSSIDDLILFHEQRRIEYADNGWTSLECEEVIKIHQLRKAQTDGIE